MAIKGNPYGARYWSGMARGMEGRYHLDELICEQKQIDLLLGVDLMLHAAKGTVDEIFLVAGDSDFVPAIRAVKSEGVLVYLVHGENPHDDLLDEADERIEITPELVSSSILLL